MMDNDRNSTDRMSGNYDRGYNDVRVGVDTGGGGNSGYGYNVSGNTVGTGGGIESGGSSFDNGCVDCQQNLYEIHV